MIYYEHTNTIECVYTHNRKAVTKMLTRNEQRTLERLGRMMQNMNDMQKAQLCAFTEGLAMALEDDRRAS